MGDILDLNNNKLVNIIVELIELLKINLKNTNSSTQSTGLIV